MLFLKSLAKELFTNGKLLVVYLLQELPGLTAYPGVKAAVLAVLAAPTHANLAYLLLQIVYTFGAGHRLVKILRTVLEDVEVAKLNARLR